MAAKNYMLSGSSVGNVVYITKSEHEELDRRVVTKGEMNAAIVAFTRSQLKHGEKVLIILENGQPVAEVKLLR